MNKSYDVYMCRPDNRPILTVGKLREIQVTSTGCWYESVDVHTAIDRARRAGYKVPFDIFQSYFADEQLRRAKPLFDGQLGAETKIIRKNGWLQSILWWQK